MPSLWFVMPAYGRLSLTRVCLRQLRRTCDSLTENGIHASAVVIADDENLDTARDLGFATVERDNRFLSKKFNDGFQLACDPAFNPRPADYAVPCGSDDWVDWRLFTNLPRPGVVLGFQNVSFVREDGRELASRVIGYQGGCGIRVYHRKTLKTLGYRPADEDRKSACDTSILVNVIRLNPRVRVIHGASDPRQIVDWKSPDMQLNSYGALMGHRGRVQGDPFEILAGRFPEEALEEMQAHFAAVPA